MPICDWRPGPEEEPEPPCPVPARQGHHWCDLHIVQDEHRRNEAEFQLTLRAYIAEQYDEEGFLIDENGDRVCIAGEYATRSGLVQLPGEDGDASDAVTRGEDAVRRGTDAKSTTQKRCGRPTRRGTPCRMFALTGREFCMNHVPEADPRSAATRASQAAALARMRPSDRLLHAAFSFTDRQSIQATYDILTRLLLSGRISETRANLVLRICSAAARNFDRTTETVKGPKPQQHDWSAYFEKVTSWLNTIDPLLAEAGERELAALDTSA